MSFIKNYGDDIFEAGLKAAGRQADDLAEAGLRTAGRQGDDLAEQIARKKFDNLAGAGGKKLDDVAGAGGKKLDDAAKAGGKKPPTGGAKNAANESDDALEAAAKMKGTTKAKIAAAAAVAGGIAYVVINPLVEANKKNGSKYTISSIKKISDTVIKITYSPGVALYKDDTLTFVGTDCVPALAGTYKINKIIDKTNVEIKTSVKLTKDGKKGTMTLHTTYDNQLKLQTEQFKDNISDGFDSFLDMLGIDAKYFTYIKYALLAIGILIILGIFYKVYTTFFKKSSFGFKKK
jgi:hypothetical protein